ncbi:MAG: penicillin acylase family protein [Gammaproteobacteria bacterium]|nr:penicillin acylase family protein [Gammaproteobacteria bacterium]
MPRIIRIALSLFVIVTMSACSPRQDAPATPSNAKYNTEIRWTSYGIPHVKANDWGSLGYGFAYAAATDAVCVIAKDVAVANGELSAHLGSESGNIESDVFHRAIITDERLKHFGNGQSADMREYAAGYAAGYNRYLQDHADTLPASCRGESWIRPIATEDVARLTVSLGIRYGLGQFKNDMTRATPPGTPVAHGETVFELPPGLGSNAVALGKDVTESGRGMLLGNPHYPWRGGSRFHIVHTTIPGKLDLMGASLYSSNFIVIGFNKDVAWTHTVSTALRFTLYELSLNPDDPMEYRYGNDYRPIEARTVSVDVRDTEGQIHAEEHTVYMTHYGPLIASDSLPWTAEKAYAIRDAVLDNNASTATYAALGVAESIDDVEAAISQQGVYWTNTIAADRNGDAFYADISATPNVDAELIDECRRTVAGLPAFVVVLDGSTAACEWKSDSRSKIAGTLPAEEMPRLRRSDYVTNSNDSFWLANPSAPLEGYSPIIGPERTARSLRTRAGLTFVGEQLAKGSKIRPADLKGVLYSHRNYAAELLLDDVLKLCDNEPLDVVLGDDKVDLTPSCDALRAWDRTANIDSHGGQVWTEFWRNARKIKNLYSVPFDANDPVNTPRGINIQDTAVATAVKESLATGQIALSTAHVALDAAWGDIQYAERNGKKIPIPGGQGWAGMFSMIVAGLSKEKGYNPIVHGNSYIQVISWDTDGKLRPGGVLTYSQSQEADSPHYSDLTELYSQKQWIDFPFTEEEILSRIQI